MIKKIIIFCLFSISFTYATAKNLSEEQKIARDKGITLYHQSAWDSAQPLLKIAAEAGDRQAQYFLGEAIRLNNFYITFEARNWYEAAANQGDLYAMLRLSNDDDFCRNMDTCTGTSAIEWRAKVLKTARERSKEGDTRAMTVLYLAGQGLKWLENAAETGDGYAQNLLASAYKSGKGWFLIPGSRERAVEKWFKRSAESGNPLGMFYYANYLYEHNGDIDEITYWVVKGAEAGHISSVGTLAGKMAEYPNDIGVPLDLIKAYGLTYLLSKLEGGGTAPEDGKRNLPKIAKKMSIDEIQKGKNFAQEWEDTHPPLSYFNPIYGY